MNKKIFITSLSLLLISGSFVFAETSSSTATSSKIEINKIKNEIEAQKAKILEDAKNIKNNKNGDIDIKKVINEKAEKKNETQKEKVLRNFDVAIRNLESLLERVDSRIGKMEQAGKDVTIIKSLGIATTGKIAVAKIEYLKLENLISQIIPAKERKTIITSIKVQSEKTKSVIKSAHATIVDTINLMRTDIEKSQSTSTNQ